jgi:hypothetical protein
MTDAPGTVVPLRPAAVPLAVRGWHGIKKRQEPWTAEQYETWAALGGESYLVDSASSSPAWLNGLQTGFWIRSINDQPFDDFERSRGRVGDVVIVRADVPGIGPVIRSLTLSAEPSKQARAPRQNTEAKRRSPQWKSEPPVLAGKRVFKDSRPAFLELAARHPHVRRHAWLLTELLKREWRIGIKIRHKKVAEAVGCSRATVQRAQDCCQHFGFLHVISGKAKHRSNSFEVCWPAGSEPQSKRETKRC